MILTKHEMAWFRTGPIYERVYQYRIDGLPAGEHAVVAEFPHHGWRVLRWNDDWHGNWTGKYDSADAAVDALREALLTAVAYGTT